ncbi:hypothetical protein BC835DRAFT_1265684 [Cytidiella melzeri]|nr:hypothetical protein BC835DRAFT_1265684 [Cytidiella melzeri]
MQPERVRISVLFYPAPHVSNEQFRRYWLQEHGRTFMSLDIVKKNLTKYEQFHFDIDVNSNLSAAMNTAPSPYWGMCVFEAESYEKITEVLSHPEYTRVVFPDEKNFIDRGRSQVISGKFVTVFERAKL